MVLSMSQFEGPNMAKASTMVTIRHRPPVGPRLDAGATYSMLQHHERGIALALATASARQEW